MATHLTRFQLLSNPFQSECALRLCHSQDENKIRMIDYGYRSFMYQVLCRFEACQSCIAGGVCAWQKIHLFLQIKNLIWKRQRFNLAALLPKAFRLLQLTLDFLLKTFKDSVCTDMASKLSLSVPGGLQKLILFLLPPSDRYCSHDGENAADRLHPCRPIYVGLWPRLWRMLAEQRPRDKGPCAERHYSDHRPVFVRPSLLHGFPLSLDWILPLGVTA